MGGKNPCQKISNYATAFMALSLLLSLWPRRGDAQDQASIDKNASYYKKSYVFTADYFYTHRESWTKIFISRSVSLKEEL